MKKQEKIITKEMLIGEVLKKYPQLAEIMLEHGMNCIGCHVASWETLEQAADWHRIDINNLVRKLNEKIEEEHV